MLNRMRSLVNYVQLYALVLRENGVKLLTASNAFARVGLPVERMFSPSPAMSHDS